MKLKNPFVAALAAAALSPTILFFGDSITAGYGLDPGEAYPALIQKKIEQAGLPHRVINAGVSGDTTASGAARIDWALRAKPAVIVIALGANDGLRGLPPATTRANLQKIIDKSRKDDPRRRIVLAGMKMPPNYGEKYTKGYAALFADLAKKNKLPLVPFLLEGVGGVDAMNQPDRIHPTAKGQERIAENVWTVLKKNLPAD